ncbi:hypothetical protein DL93DRAFT_2095577 [Clavulina sp. PMI_390]|nr:hypothetical protein DL93DRAFT_2095577 [Clavulina sp. PMI_390]
MAQRRETARQMRKRNELQPIFRLPKEILILIVELGIPMIGDVWSGLTVPSSLDREPRWEQWTIKEYKNYRQSLWSTCSAFLSLIMQSPRFWSCILLDLSRSLSWINPNSMQPSDLIPLKNSLERSSPIPFDLFITNEESEMLDAWGDFREILSPHLHRCQGILIASAYPTDRLFKQLFADADFCALKHLILSWGDWRSSVIATRHDPRHFTFFELTLPLESLSLCDSLKTLPYDVLRTLADSSSLSTLRRLRLFGANPPEMVVPFLQHCQILEHLTWRLPSCRTNKVYSTSPLSLPRLVTLTVHGFEAVRSLPPINAPRLEQIILEGEVHYDPEYLIPTTILPSYKSYPPACIFHPTQTSLPALRRLYFNPRFHNQDHVLLFLASHPLLHDVMINNPPLTSNSEEDARGLSLIIDALAPLPSQSASVTDYPTSPLVSLHVNLVRADLDRGAGESLLFALKRLLERVPRIEIHYMAREDMDPEPSSLPQLYQCGSNQFHCIWLDPWSECERLGDDLSQGHGDWGFDHSHDYAGSAQLSTFDLTPEGSDYYDFY